MRPLPRRAPGSLSETNMTDIRLVDVLCADQLRRWRAGERVPVEAYLKLHPTLRENDESLFELIYGEFLVREALGEVPQIEEFLGRFPQFAERLRRQLQLHG
jgi:eukaryotic-like serine/threonine-protein kinase